MKKSSILRFTKSFINRNFRIKVYGLDAQGNRINKLVGVAGIIALIGIDLLNKFIDRALNAGLDKCVCKLRRGLQVSFYCK
ncbi:MAG: ribosomal large subunit pseudouridine synthase B [Clostridia bacterium]|nr:ribosomal large subunit pseudouridine synthase B [Clostridia bacterium]MBR5271858.1 ribosomal large subunit pseudouridine synthase B [Clostridia bacterium]